MLRLGVHADADRQLDTSLPRVAEQGQQSVPRRVRGADSVLLGVDRILVDLVLVKKDGENFFLLAAVGVALVSLDDLDTVLKV